ncbi:hypothetical protein [Streptomyces spectabilis]|uniref:Uncharacterized protein n=1 Tax=Streptomyces spectabilis TaxID=68270 RepID=A0A5P2XB74_STRST|nr:hypothetical protein [Streptomyces spectabilis]MBB5103289.1 hypothetical protein [Streptomyces spectabilis]MCI3902479.1 hypothetical protein [Streptomyces spectabilis]QEV59816.1 hypothetical protein CP982_14595 [Streptomyces spectabilis]GGV13611.1 hypothetical protein GCM10010245_23750 [Streptomyces spectabilis]
MAETIYLRGEGGGIHAMDLPLHESIQQRLERGQLRRVNADGSPLAAEQAPAGPADDSTPDADPAAPSGRPPVNAPKADWISYIVAQGQLSFDDAANLTKADLIDLADAS